MSYATNVGETIVEIDQQQQSAFSWNVAIVGALAAIAISILFYALGTGIGLALVSPYSDANPSAGTMTAIGAVWLIIAQTFAFATGGYLAGRLRTRSHIPGVETRFRDAAHGFMSWAIGVVIVGFLAVSAGAYLAGSATAVTAAVAGSSAGGTAQSASNDRVAYYVDTLFRADPTQQVAANASASPSTPTTSGQATAAEPLQPAQRAEVQRIIFTSIRNGKLDDSDKTYLSKLVAARTGLSEQDAQQRVTDTESKARAAITQAADTARAATAYMSFWSFMALLFGAVAGGVGGMVGGALRDEEWSAAEEMAR